MISFSGTCGVHCNETQNCNLTSSCPETFFGPNCSVQCIPRDSCEGHYTCHPTTGAKVCTSSSWGGLNCQTWINTSSIFNYQCPDSAVLDGCQNGGTCFNKTCCCLPGYTGNLCQFNLSNPCASSPCLNGGECLFNGTACSCNCSTGLLAYDYSPRLVQK